MVEQAGSGQRTPRGPGLRAADGEKTLLNQGGSADVLGLSRHWGDDSMSDTIGQYVAGWRIADAVGFGADWNRDRWSIVARVA